MQGEKEEALSKRWEIEIHISYSGVSANADPEGFNCFNLCFIPRREMRSISSRGPIVFTYVLSPEGRYVVYPVGVQLFLHMF